MSRAAALDQLITRHAHSPRRLALAVAAIALLLPLAAAARPFDRFLVPDSALSAALRAPDYEGAWNSLLVTELRASLAARGDQLADSAAIFRRLERRVAEVETRDLGTRIGTDALALRAHWNTAAQRNRVTAAVSESLAVAAQRAIRYEEAERQFRVALQHYRRLNERRRTAWVLGSLGVVTFQQGDLARADSVYREALVARRALGDDRMTGNTLNALGTVALQRQRWAEAYGWFQQAAEVRERTHESAALGATLGYLGTACVELGKPDSARICFDRALELTVAAGDSVRTADVLINTARLLGQTGEYDRAYALTDRALAIAEERGDLRYLRAAHDVAGHALRRQARFTRAAERFERAAQYAEQAGDVRAQFDVLLSLGQTWLNLEDPERARPPLDRALALADSLDDPALEVGALNDLAIAARLAGDVDRARALSSRALERAVQAGDSVLVHDTSVSVGQLAFERGDAAAAAASFARARAATTQLSPDQRAIDLIDHAAALSLMMRLDEAEREFRAALELATDAGTIDQQWLALLGLGDVAERRGNVQHALQFDRRAASLIDTLRAAQGEERGSITVFSRRLFAYEALIHLLSKHAAGDSAEAYAREAFAWAERSRARALLDRMGTGTASAVPATTRSLDDVRGLIASDRDAVLEFSAGDSSTTLWVIRRSGFARFTLPPSRALRTRVLAVRNALAGAAGMDLPAARRASRWLYRALIEPAEKELRGVKRLIIVPDGPLTALPFEAMLARETPDTGPLPRDVWLLDRFDVSYAPSASVWAMRAAGERTRTEAIVAVGDADLSRRSGAVDPAGATSATTLVPLPYTAEELDALGALAGKRPLVTLRGAAASRARLLATPELHDADIVHIATHGEANELDPERSGLWLAADTDTVPSFLSVTDIEGCRLAARLVTLSACRSGLGRIERGEGMLGLSRAFMLAGAHGVIVSLWDVNDRSTAALMRRFYGHLLSGRKAPAAALAAAKRETLDDKQTRSPFYWAPFVLIAERTLGP